MTPLKYLKQELGFTSREWLDLPLADRAELMTWAREEMAVLGINPKD